MASPRLERIEPRGSWTELIQAIDRSSNFSDVDESDIWEWLLERPNITRITHLDHGWISALILTRITEHTHRMACFTAPSDAQINFELKHPAATSDTFLVAGIIFGHILRDMHNDRILAGIDYDPRRTRVPTTADAIEIATLGEFIIAGRIQGITLRGSSFVHRAGYLFGIRIEPTLMEGEITRLARMRNRTHISTDNLIVDYSQFRTTLQSFSHFLADKEVVILGPGYYRICPLREALSHIADLYILIVGMTSPPERIAQLTLDLLNGY